MNTAANPSPTGVETPQTRVRYLILFMLFVITTINYADRATISIAGPEVSKRPSAEAIL